MDSHLVGLRSIDLPGGSGGLIFDCFDSALFQGFVPNSIRKLDFWIAENEQEPQEKRAFNSMIRARTEGGHQ